MRGQEGRGKAIDPMRHQRDAARASANAPRIEKRLFEIKKALQTQLEVAVRLWPNAGRNTSAWSGSSIKSERKDCLIHDRKKK